MSPTIQSLIDDLREIDRNTCACSSGPMRVLLVEDDPSDVDMMYRILNKHGCTVDVVMDGRSALNAIKADPGRYCVMFLDINLPEIDGVSVLVETRKITKVIHIVIVTGGNRLNEIPPDAYFAVIRKPLDDKMVIEIMSKTARSPK